MGDDPTQPPYHDANDSLEGAFAGNGVGNSSSEGLGRAATDSNDMFMHRMFDMLMAENRRRDEMMSRLMERLTPQPRAEPADNEATNSFHVMPDFSRTVGAFEGDKDVTEAEDWLGNLETSANLNHWSSQYTLEVARAQLRGAARHWFAAKRDQIYSWEDFKREFKKTYFQTLKTSEKWERLRARKQRHNESVMSYFYEKVKLCNSLQLTTEETKEEILAGLSSQDVAMTLMVKNHEDYDALLKDIIAVEKVKGTKVRLPPSKPQETNSTTRIIVCYNCKGKGHLSKDCKEKVQQQNENNNSPTCFRCKQTGHFKRDCPNAEGGKKEEVKSKENKSQMLVEPNKEIDDASGKYYREVTLNGSVKVIGFIDPGSAVCTIKDSLVNKYQLMCRPANEALHGFGKNTVTSLWRTHIKIKVDDVEEEVEVLVVADDTQPMDLLIGRTYTENPSIAFMRYGNSLYFGYKDRDPFKDLQLEEKQDKVKIVVSRDQKLQENRINFLDVKIEANEYRLPVLNIQKERVVKEGTQVAELRENFKESSDEMKERSSREDWSPITKNMIPIEEPQEEGMMEQVADRRSNVFVLIPEEEEMLMIQRSDERLNRIIQIMGKEREQRTAEEENLTKGYKVERGRLYKVVKVKGEDRMLYAVPDSMRKATVIKYHDQRGHWSVDRTVEAILKICWFPKIRRYVRVHIKSCLECLMTKQPGGKKPGLLHTPKLPSRPMEKLHIDHLGPFVKSTRGKSHLFVIVDAYTRYVKLYPVVSTTSAETVRCLEKFILQFGAPRKIVSDRGTAFTAKHFQEFCNKYGIEHQLIAAHYPQANGAAERQMRSIVPLIITTMKSDEKWDQGLDLVERNLNAAVNKTTGRSAFECLYGYNPTFEDSLLVRVAEREEDQKTLEEIRQEVQERVRRVQDKTKEGYDKRRCIGETFEVGDIVVMKTVPVSQGQPTKTQSKYRGPLVVIKVSGSDTYRVQSLCAETGKTGYTTDAHVSQLKRYRNPEELEIVPDIDPGPGGGERVSDSDDE